jgi:hypothetical protein
MLVSSVPVSLMKRTESPPFVKILFEPSENALSVGISPAGSICPTAWAIHVKNAQTRAYPMPRQLRNTFLA